MAQQKPKLSGVVLILLVVSFAIGAFGNQWLHDSGYGHLGWPLTIGTAILALIVWLSRRRKKRDQ